MVPAGPATVTCSDVKLLLFLDSTAHPVGIHEQDFCSWPLSRPGIFTPSSHWTVGYVGPTDGVDTVEKAISCASWKLNPRFIGHPVRSLV
jgi:hypothetical protein